MKNSLFKLAACGALCLAACGGKKSDNKSTGQVRLRSAASALDATATTPICAHFTLQPYAPSSDGSPNNAGPAIDINSSLGGGTDAIEGCIDGPSDTDGYNWGYIVTATTFSACGTTPGTLGAPFTNVFPSTVTFLQPVHCHAGLDEQVNITAQVSIPTANQAGYVDISTQVNATPVQVGCKQADIGLLTDHKFHFGESYIDGAGAVQTGLVAFDSGSPTQFGGTVNAPGGALDTFYTGTIAPNAFHTLYQTFVNSCAPGQEFAQPRHAQCVSNNGGLPSGTSAELADAFIELPGAGFAAASVVGGGLQIYSSLGSGAPVTMTSGPSFTPGFNALTSTSIGASDPALAAFTVTGVYVDQGHAMQFLVAATAGDGSPVFATLSASGGAWTLSSFHAADGDAIHCRGLYSTPSSCFAIKDCSSGDNARAVGPIIITPLATYWLYAFYSGPAAWRPSINANTTGEPTLNLDPSQPFPTFGIRFANKLNYGAAYNISVTPPANVNCIVQHGSGTMTSAPVTSANIFCGPKAWKQVAAGFSISDGIATDGTLWTWGANYQGTLGLSANLNAQFTPIQIGTDNQWKQVATGINFSVAIKNDGTLWAWGNIAVGTYGLGDGTTNALSVPTQIGAATDWAQVAATYEGIAALKTNGTLWGWGYNLALSAAGVLVPTQVGTANDWLSINGGGTDYVLIKQNHTGWAWGSMFMGATPTQLDSATDWASGASGDLDLFVIKQNGSLWGMGYNPDGELGDGTQVDKTALTQIGAGIVWKQISPGEYHTAAVATNGNLYTWGLNNSGQLGTGNNANSLVPVLVGGGYAATTGAIGDLTFGLKNDQSLWSWGSFGTYALGYGGYNFVLSPNLVP